MLLAIDVALMHSYYDPIFPLIALAFIASAGLTALMYMLGNALQSQDMLAMGKDNLANLVFSAIIVLLFFAFFVLFTDIAGAIACGGPCDPLEAAYYGVLLLRTKLMSLYVNLYFYEIVFGFLSTLGFSIPLPAVNPATLGSLLISMPSFSFAPLSGLTPVSNAHTVVVEAVGTALLMVLARQVILEFIMRYMAIFFVFGAGLRAFSFTRRTGSSILALCAAAYFVYPLAIMLTNYMIFQAYTPTNFGVVPTAIGYCENPEDITELSERFDTERENELYKMSLNRDQSNWYSFWNFFVDAAEFVGSAIKSMLKTLVSFNMLYILGLALSPMMFSVFFDFLIMEIQVLVQFLVLTFVSFVIEIIIVITMYRGIAMFLEGEAEIFGISKLM